MPVLAALDGGPSHVCRLVPVQPLLAEHRKEGGEERDGETRKQDCLYVNQSAWRAVPLWKSGNIVSECGVIDLIDKDAEEGDSLVARVWLKLRVDLGNKCGGNSGKQSSLFFRSVDVHQSFI